MNTLDRVLRALGAFRRVLTGAPGAGGEGPRIGLALGGGFARGLAHIGVLKALEEAKIPVHMVAGTSVGALLGAIYCSGVSVREMEKIAHMVRFKDFARWTISLHGLANNDRMIPFLDKVLKVKTFEELKVPLAVVATDIVSGEPVVFRSGPIIPAVRASCAYPGIFLPVEVNGRLLVDGMLAYSVPTIPLRQMGAERVLALQLKSRWVSRNGPRHVLEIIGQCFSIAQSRMTAEWEAAADLVLQPEVSDFAYDAFDRATEIIQRGEDAARAVMPQIRGWFVSPAKVAAPATATKSATAPVK